MNTNVMAQDPATPPVEGTPAAANSADGKELIDPNHKPESVFEGQAGTPVDKSKKHLKNKKHRKNKKPQA